MGRRLAIEHPVEADVVIPVPDSGMAAAIGYARESGIPYDQGLMRSHYMGRTFIEPSQQIRHFGVKLKLSPVREVLKGKRVVVVDDSIVRGTTSRKIVGMIRSAGAREVHLRISSPPTDRPCCYGIDTPTSEELIGANHSIDEIRDFVGADSLGYLSLDGLYQSVEGWRPEVGATDGGRKGCRCCRRARSVQRVSATPASPAATRSPTSSRRACASCGSSAPESLRPLTASGCAAKNDHMVVLALMSGVCPGAPGHSWPAPSTV